MFASSYTPTDPSATESTEFVGFGLQLHERLKKQYGQGCLEKVRSVLPSCSKAWCACASARVCVCSCTCSVNSGHVACFASKCVMHGVSVFLFG
jgi:hypothetical protein